MTLEKAKRIQWLRTGKPMHSLRRIAEIIEEELPQHPELSGNQMWGHELVIDAIKTIYGKDVRDLDDDLRELWDC